MPAETAQAPFTNQQLAWLERWLERHRPASERSFDRATLMWIIGGLTALGIVAFGVLWSEIGSVRGEIGSVRGEIGSVRGEIGSVRGEIESVRGEIGSVRGEIGSLRAELGEEIRENRAAIVELAKGQARIEAILEERLPRPD